MTYEHVTNEVLIVPDTGGLLKVQFIDLLSGTKEKYYRVRRVEFGRRTKVIAGNYDEIENELEDLHAYDFYPDTPAAVLVKGAGVAGLKVIVEDYEYDLSQSIVKIEGTPLGKLRPFLVR